MERYAPSNVEKKEKAATCLGDQTALAELARLLGRHAARELHDTTKANPSASCAEHQEAEAPEQETIK